MSEFLRSGPVLLHVCTTSVIFRCATRREDTVSRIPRRSSERTISNESRYPDTMNRLSLADDCCLYVNLSWFRRGCCPPPPYCLLCKSAVIISVADRQTGSDVLLRNNTKPLNAIAFPVSHHPPGIFSLLGARRLGRDTIFR